LLHRDLHRDAWFWVEGLLLLLLLLLLWDGDIDDLRLLLLLLLEDAGLEHRDVFYIWVPSE
jgi:hypothetical protein